MSNYSDTLLKADRIEATFADVLGICYIVIFIAITIQFIRLLNHRHNIFSFQSMFLFLFSLLLILRILFWYLANDSIYENFCFMVLWLLPNVIQNIVFSMIVFFFVKTQSESWHTVKNLYITLYWFFVAVLIGLTMIFGFLFSREYSGNLTTCYYFVFGSINIGIGIAAIFFLVKFIRKRVKQRLHDMKGLLLVTCFISIVLLSRGVIDLLSGAGIETYSNLQELRTSQPDGTYHFYKLATPFSFVCILMWEIFPPFFMLIYFRHVPSSGNSRIYSSYVWLRVKCGASPDELIYDEPLTSPIIPTVVQTNDDKVAIQQYSAAAFDIFKNEKRYDSDDEYDLDYDHPDLYKFLPDSLPKARHMPRLDTQ